MTDYVAGWILPEEGRTRDEAAHELMTKLAELLPAGPGDRLVTEGYFDPAAEAYRIVLHRIPAPVVREESPEEADARLRLALEEAIASPGGRAVAEAILERKKLADALEGRKIDLSGSIPVELPGRPAGIIHPVELSPAYVDSEEAFAREIADRGAEIVDGMTGKTYKIQSPAEHHAETLRPENSNRGYPTLAELRAPAQIRVKLRHEDGTFKTNDEIREEAARLIDAEAGRLVPGGYAYDSDVEDRIDREIDEAIGRGEI